MLAPSADNNHVFQVEFSASAIRLLPTREFARTTDRLGRVLGLISLGAVVENMRLRAGELGLVSQTTWFPTDSAGLIAEMNFQPDPAAPGDELAAAIPARHTNRRMYHGPGLSDDETALLSDAAESVEDVRLIWLHGDARRRALGLIWRAESERFLRERLHEDLFSSIRFDLSWHETADQALPPGALEIEAPMRPLFKALRHWALMQPLTWVGLHRLIGLRAGWFPAWQAPALGVFASTLPIDRGACSVGAALERLWLQATLLKLALQPLAASAVLMQQTTKDVGASDNLRLKLAAGWHEITPNATPLMVFRMGRSTGPSVRTSRKPVADYWQSEREE